MKKDRQKFKEVLEDRLKHYLGTEFTQIIADKTQYSYQYVNKWFNSQMVQRGIQSQAENLLREEAAKEQDKIRELKAL